MKADLEAILKDTLLETVDRELDAKTEATLRSVAAKHPGRPFSEDPVAIELVQAVLAVFFEKWSREPQVFSRMSRSIAQTLCREDETRERLEKLWQELGEEER